MVLSSGCRSSSAVLPRAHESAGIDRVSAELHIAGVLVHARPDALQAVAESIGDIASARVHAVHPEGRLVVTLEAANALAVRKCLEHMRGLPGVLAASLVYQHSEPLDAMNQEVSDEAHAPGIL